MKHAQSCTSALVSIDAFGEVAGPVLLYYFSSDFGERKGKLVLVNCIAYIV